MVDTVYKLTNQDNTTYNKTCWGPGVTHSGTGAGNLCGPGFIHAYTHPLLAVLLNPIHANLANPKLWRCETTVVRNDRGLKVGGVSLTTIEEIPLPVVTEKQRVLFAALCVQKTAKDLSWKYKWDEYVKLLRSDSASRAAYAAAADAAHAAAHAAATARAAANAADYAARAARAANAADYAARAAARAAANAADYAARAANAARAAHAAATARAAANAADYAARAARAARAADLDLIRIAEEAVRCG